MADRKISQLTEQTSPAADDIFPIVDVDEALSVDRNKKITFKTIHNALQDGTAAAPVVSFINDANSTGLFRSGTNELAFTAAGSYVAKITTAGFQVGTGTAAAQFHLFSADTTDQVIIENTDDGADTAPDVVLYRNSASAANGDDLGNLGSTSLSLQTTLGCLSSQRRSLAQVRQILFCITTETMLLALQAMSSALWFFKAMTMTELPRHKSNMQRLKARSLTQQEQLKTARLT